MLYFWLSAIYFSFMKGNKEAINPLGYTVHICLLIDLVYFKEAPPSWTCNMKTHCMYMGKVPFDSRDAILFFITFSHVSMPYFCPKEWREQNPERKRIWGSWNTLFISPKTISNSQDGHIKCDGDAWLPWPQRQQVSRCFFHNICSLLPYLKIYVGS